MSTYKGPGGLPPDPVGHRCTRDHLGGALSEHAVDVPSGRQEAEEYVADPRRWRILGVALAVGFMSLLDVSIVNVAIPSMRAGLDTTAATIDYRSAADIDPGLVTAYVREAAAKHPRR